MFRHNLIAALRNMAANKLSTAIAIIGLSIGITAAILMALVIRNQLNYDRFILGYERIYMGVSALSVPDHPVNYEIMTHRNVAAMLRLNAPEVEDVTRLMLSDKAVYRSGVELRRGDVSAIESLYWADPNAFDVLRLPVYRGNLQGAMKQADGIVLPRETARKYFGRDDAVGQTLLVAGHPMTVRAIIEDLPENGTELRSGIFASGLASFSGIARDAQDPPGNFTISVVTYLRLKPGISSAGVESRLARLIAPLWDRVGGAPGHPPYAMRLVRIDRVNLFEGLNPGARTRLVIAGVVGFLILFIAAANFINLLTARAGRRALEVGVRKACGAGMGALVKQFLGESILTVLLASAIAVVLAEWLLGPVNNFLASGAVFQYWRDPSALAVLVAAVVLVGLAAGAYPAFVMSSFRPVSALKDKAGRSGGAGLGRNALVIAQFAILIVLAVAAMVVWLQRVYATNEGLRANVDQVLMVRSGCLSPAFVAEIRKLPGVARASCSGIELLSNSNSSRVIYKGQTVTLDSVSAAFGVFGIYGVQPVAGSLTTLSPQGDYDPDAAPGIVLNESAIRKLGFASPGAAIGQSISRSGPQALPVPIVAVVPDFAFYSVERPMEPTIYVPQKGMGVTSIKLRGQQIPETLAAIDRLWSATGNVGPITRFFVADRMQEQYLGMTRQAQLFAIFSGVAVFLACLGLAGLSLSATERRIKEIGIRKAMGATDTDIVGLLLWQFSQPVLWATLIAWPAAWWLMRRWLAAFAYHIDLHWWVFVAASLGALLIALLTVAGQAWTTARQKPVLALRYE